jgi:hypothetical protein
VDHHGGHHHVLHACHERRRHHSVRPINHQTGAGVIYCCCRAVGVGYPDSRTDVDRARARLLKARLIGTEDHRTHVTVGSIGEENVMIK